MRGCSIGDPEVTTQRILPRIEIAQLKKIQFLQKVLHFVKEISY